MLGWWWIYTTYCTYATSQIKSVMKPFYIYIFNRVAFIPCMIVLFVPCVDERCENCGKSSRLCKVGQMFNVRFCGYVYIYIHYTYWYIYIYIYIHMHMLITDYIMLNINTSPTPCTLSHSIPLHLTRRRNRRRPQKLPSSRIPRGWDGEWWYNGDMMASSGTLT